MAEKIAGHYPYIFVALLIMIGLYGMLLKRNLVKQLIGMTILQNAIIIFFIIGAFKENATVPIKESGIPVTDPANYINPLPHTLMLTAIVVGVATVGVALALLIRIHQKYQTLDEQNLLERMK